MPCESPVPAELAAKLCQQPADRSRTDGEYNARTKCTQSIASIIPSAAHGQTHHCRKQARHSTPSWNTARDTPSTHGNPKATLNSHDETLNIVRRPRSEDSYQKVFYGEQKVFYGEDNSELGDLLS